MTINPEDVKRSAEIDRLMSRANVHRMRGEYIEVEDLCKQIIELDENNADARELMADMLFARGQLQPAADEYKKLLEYHPDRVSAETKYAKVILEMGENEHEKQIAQEMLENPGKYKEPQSHPLLAFIFSAVVPGVGQLYNREMIKGYIILGVFIFSLLILAMSPDTKNLLQAFGALMNPQDAPTKPPPVGKLVILMVGALVFTYIYAVIDAPIAAAKAADKVREKLSEPGS